MAGYNIMVIGCGGTGGWAIPWLINARFLTKGCTNKVNRIYLYDPDIVEARNLERQNFGTIHYGIRKDESFQMRYRRYGIPIEVVPDYDTLMSSYHKYKIDILILAVDSLEARKMYLDLDAPLRLDSGNRETFGQIFIGLSDFYEKFMANPKQQKKIDISCAELDQTIFINAWMGFQLGKIAYKYMYEGEIPKQKMIRWDLKKQGWHHKPIRWNHNITDAVEPCLDPVATPVAFVSAWLLCVGARIFNQTRHHLGWSDCNYIVTDKFCKELYPNTSTLLSTAFTPEMRALAFIPEDTEFLVVVSRRIKETYIPIPFEGIEYKSIPNTDVLFDAVEDTILFYRNVIPNYIVHRAAA